MIRYSLDGGRNWIERESIIVEHDLDDETSIQFIHDDKAPDEEEGKLVDANIWVHGCHMVASTHVSINDVVRSAFE